MAHDSDRRIGLALFGATAAALAWANSPWHASYHTAWQGWRHTAVNDGLMSVFFFVVGLEVKRELLRGELRDRAHATVPVVAAVGGMVVPVLLYIAIAPAGARHGWGIPMATDVAFALTVLSLAPRLPKAMRAFLLTLAVVDDIGAVVVIALVYHPAGLPIHPTLLAVAAALAVPLRTGAHLERGLSPFTGMVVLPVFALANAGVRLADTTPTRVTLAVAIALVVGKLAGVSSASAVAASHKTPGRLTPALGPRHIAGVGLVAGIGFTVSLFVADLAFATTRTAAAAKLGVLAGSLIAGAAGTAYLRRF